MIQDAPLQLLSLLQAADENSELVERVATDLIARAIEERACCSGELMCDTQDPNLYALTFGFSDEAQLQAFLDAEWRVTLLRELPVGELDVRRHAFERITSSSIA